MDKLNEWLRKFEEGDDVEISFIRLFPEPSCQNISFGFNIKKTDGFKFKVEISDYKKFMKYLFPECEVVDCQSKGRGHPDFIIKKDEEKIYIEFKNNNDNIYTSQLCWFLSNNKEECYILFTENISLKDYNLDNPKPYPNIKGIILGEENSKKEVSSCA
jgi:hypothetical protein